MVAFKSNTVAGFTLRPAGMCPPRDQPALRTVVAAPPVQRPTRMRPIDGPMTGGDEGSM